MAFPKPAPALLLVLIGTLAMLSCETTALVIKHIPIPATSDSLGFASGNVTAPVKLEAFFDLMCGDCRNIYSEFKSAVSSYKSEELRVVIHLFALAFHHNAFFSMKSTFAITGLKPSDSPDTISDFTKFMEACFDQQSRFVDSSTMNMTATAVIDRFAQLANNTTGVSIDSFKARMADPNYEQTTRAAWKYGLGRGVTSTPAFFVNGGAIYSTGDSDWTADDLRSVIDPLLQSRRAREL